MRRLPRFAYAEPATLEEAVAALADGGGAARPLAGGTDLVVDMKAGRLRPAAVVNLKRIAGLSSIEEADGGLRIGALTTVAALERSPLVARHPALARGAAVLATPPVRAMATVGGNLGRASPASDLAPPLVALGASVEVVGPGGRSRRPVEGLATGPGTTVLGPADLIASVHVPDPPPHSGSAHLKLGARAGGTDIAVVGVTVRLVLGADGGIAEARIVLASMGPTVLRAAEAEGLLIGAGPDGRVLEGAAAAAAAAGRPIDDLRAGAAHRTAIARVLTLRALRAALASARDGGRA